MKLTFVAAATMALLSAPAFAEGHADLTATGDAAAGERAIRQCQSCHVEQNEAGATLAGQDPTAKIREASGDSSARGKMSFRVRKDEDALNLYAYIQSLSE